MPTQPTPDPKLQPLPRLRDDLAIEEAGADDQGFPRWRLSDPLHQRHFTLTDHDVRLLANWHHADTPQALANRLQAAGHACSLEDIAQLSTFLRQHHLLVATTDDERADLLGRERARKAHGLQRLLRLYLGWKHPLLKPAAFLSATLPAVRLLASWPALALWGLASGFGLYLVSRQWDQFLATLVELLSWQSLLTYAVAMSMLKGLHELGHAYVATHHGCRVATMGVMVSMGLPMLYTDTSDAVRITQARARMAIGAAGMAVEVWLAGISLLIWAAMPEGGIKSVAFVVATSSLLTSLFINLNPLGRFDGYYILCDALGTENLQSRSLSQFGWRLRQWVLGSHEPAPEALNPSHARWMTAYGLACWLYRASIYIGMAATAWWAGLRPLAFMALGLGLYLQCWVPWRQWRSTSAPLRQIVAPARYLALAMVLAGVGAALLLPLDRTADGIAVLRSEHESQLRVPSPARVLEVHVQEGAHVEAGTPLAVLDSPDLRHSLRQSDVKLGLTELRLRRVVADPQDLNQVKVLASEYQAQLAAQQAAQADVAKLTLRADMTGRVRDISNQLKVGAWVRADQSLIRLVAERGINVTAYISLDDVHRLHSGARAVFMPQRPHGPPVPMIVEQIELVASEQVQPRWLASPEGGPIMATKDDKGRYIPSSPIYAVKLSPADPQWLPTGVLTQEMGQIHIDAEPESVLQRAWNHVRRVWRSPT